MYLFLYILAAVVSLIISALLLLMFVRAILSWFPPNEDSAITQFVYVVTETVIIPVRVLFERFGWCEGMPIDVPFFVTFLILSVLGLLL